jgi:hypothetical protein
MDHTTTAVEQDKAGEPADEDMDLDDDFDEADIEMNEDGRPSSRIFSDSNLLTARLVLQIMTLMFLTKSQNSEQQHELVRSWAKSAVKPLLSINKFKRRDRLP